MDKDLVFRGKICLIGESGVGKTSLIRRYVLDQFSDNYLSTFGTKVMKKQLSFNLPNKQKASLLLTVWDIMGEKELIGVVKESYFQGASGLVAVCDLTRPETLPALANWIGAANKVIGDMPIVLAGNKLDLISPVNIRELAHSIEKFAKENQANAVLTSAKTGENVEIAFKKIGASVLAEMLKHETKHQTV